MPHLQMLWKNQRKKTFQIETVLISQPIKHELSPNRKEIAMSLPSHGKFVSSRLQISGSRYPFSCVMPGQLIDNDCGWNICFICRKVSKHLLDYFSYHCILWNSPPHPTLKSFDCWNSSLFGKCVIRYPTNILNEAASIQLAILFLHFTVHWFHYILLSTP